LFFFFATLAQSFSFSFSGHPSDGPHSAHEAISPSCPLAQHASAAAANFSACVPRAGATPRPR
jgi:hypothetical protein